MVFRRFGIIIMVTILNHGYRGSPYRFINLTSANEFQLYMLKAGASSTLTFILFVCPFSTIELHNVL